MLASSYMKPFGPLLEELVTEEPILLFEEIASAAILTGLGLDGAAGVIAVRWIGGNAVEVAYRVNVASLSRLLTRSDESCSRSPSGPRGLHSKTRCSQYSLSRAKTRMPRHRYTRDAEMAVFSWKWGS